MNFLKNRHSLTAAIVAPVLAVVAYFAVDILVGEKPQPAEAGQSYELVEKPNCRRDSGQCGLKNGEFELTLTAEPIDGGHLLLRLSSAFPLDGVRVGLAESENPGPPPEEMQSLGADGRKWSWKMQRPDPNINRLRLVASANQALYFGDVSLTFTAGIKP